MWGTERSFLVKARVRPEPNHATDELGREAPEAIRPPSPRATPPIVRSRREHPGESVEVEAFVVHPTARTKFSLELPSAGRAGRDTLLTPSGS